MAFGISAGTLITAGAGLAGAAISASGAKSAANTQAAATDRANDISEKQYEQTRTDLAPYRNYGSSATDKLMYMLGLGGAPGGSAGVTYDEARSKLLPQYTKSSDAGSGWYQNSDSDGQPAYWMRMVNGVPQRGDYVTNENFAQYAGQGGQGGTSGSNIDEAGLDAAIKQMMASSGAQPDSNGADYGSLLKPFTGADLENEPGYKFGLDQGLQAIDRRTAAGGNYFSGAAIKAAARFGNDYAGTKYNDAYTRDASTKRQAYDFLSGGVTSGQNASAQTGSAGTSMSGTVGANTTALGNAQGAAAIAGGNAWNSGLQGIVNNYQQNKLIDAIRSRNTAFST